MLDFDELQELEQARVAEDEEEDLKNESERTAQKTLELEALANERLQKQEYEERTIQGVLVKVNVANSNMFFCDAVNKALKALKKIFDSENKFLANVGGRIFKRRVEILVALLNFLVWNYYADDTATVAIFQRIANSFESESGLRAMLQRWCTVDAQRKSFETKGNDIKTILDKEMKNVLACSRRLLAAIIESTVPKDFLVLIYRDALAFIFPKTPPPMSGCWHEQGLDLRIEDEVEIVVHCPGGNESSRTLIMSGSLQVHDLRDHLVEDCGLPNSIELCSSAGPLQHKEGLRNVPGFINVKGMTCFGQSLEPALDGSKDDPDWLLYWQKLGIFRLFKLTAITATRILYELRDHFTEDSFQARYAQLKKVSDSGNEAHTELLSMTWSVQKRILPNYGFEATPSALNNMRDDVAFFASWDIWNWRPSEARGHADEVVWKVRRDIHYVLDMGGKLPALQTGLNMSPGDAWLLMAKLHANYDTACFRASRLIAKADILLLCTGAGFSADSGLAVYADVAKVRAYKQRSLEYKDLCNMYWLRDEPELFWGFWGQCYNDYRETAPHEGFKIISDWVDGRLRNSETANAVRKRLAERAGRPLFEDPYEVNDFAGAFFVFTSNVDTHHYDWFRASEIRECHGNTELFQCSGVQKAPPAVACEKVWRSPRTFKFHVDKETMLAPKKVPASVGQRRRSKQAVSEAEEVPSQFAGKWTNDMGTTMTITVEGDLAKLEESGLRGTISGNEIEWSGKGSGVKARITPDGEFYDGYNNIAWKHQDAPQGPDQTPVIGHVRGGGRPDALRYMPDPPEEMQSAVGKGFANNHPLCPFCSGPARPAIMMFDDLAFRDVPSQKHRWQDWMATVKSLIKEKHDNPIQAVILEIGAGNRVPTVRCNSEQQLRAMHEAGADAHLIRINPELPLADTEDLQPNGELSELVISIMGGGLKTLHRIDTMLAQA